MTARRSGIGRTTLSLAASLAMVAALSSCTSSTERFCDRLAEDYRLEDLAAAINERDERGITAGLERLRQLEDAAPPEIYEDLRAVVDAAVRAVRVVTKVPGPDGEVAPVDLFDLGQALASVQDSAQQVADFADEECGLQLNP